MALNDPTPTCLTCSMSDACLRECMYESSPCYCSHTELSMVIQRSRVMDFFTVYIHVRKFCARLVRLAKILPPSATVLSQWLSRSHLFASCPAMHPKSSPGGGGTKSHPTPLQMASLLD